MYSEVRTNRRNSLCGHFYDVNRELYMKLPTYFKRLTFHYNSLRISPFSTAVMCLSGSSDSVTAWRHVKLPATLNM